MPVLRNGSVGDLGEMGSGALIRALNAVELLLGFVSTGSSFGHPPPSSDGHAPLHPRQRVGDHRGQNNCAQCERCIDPRRRFRQARPVDRVVSVKVCRRFVTITAVVPPDEASQGDETHDKSDNDDN